MKKMINKAHVEGRISECELEVKVSKAGVTYIGGKIDVATDNEGLNIVTVDFPYVAKFYKNGNENKTFSALYPLAIEKDKDGNVIKTSTAKTLMGNQDEEPTMVRLDPSVALNEWYDKEKDGERPLVSNKRLSGGFAHVVNAISSDEAARNRFECDMVITGTRLIEADEERGTQEKLIVKGCIFDYANRIMPIELSVTNPNGIAYFDEKIDATPSTPVFTKVWGKIVNETIVKEVVTESAFGESMVTESRKTKRDWILTGMAVDPYDFDSEGCLTAQELQEAIAEREVYKATLLQSQEQREAEKAKNNNAFTAGTTATAPAVGGFQF